VAGWDLLLPGMKFWKFLAQILNVLPRILAQVRQILESILQALAAVLQEVALQAVHEFADILEAVLEFAGSMGLSTICWAIWRRILTMTSAIFIGRPSGLVGSSIAMVPRSKSRETMPRMWTLVLAKRILLIFSCLPGEVGAVLGPEVGAVLARGIFSS